MIEELKEERIIRKVGGRFKLSTLMQKRLVQLNAGAKALVEGKFADNVSIVMQEILQDKIYLDTSSDVRVTGATNDGMDAPDLDASIL